jgi:general secretion pathway protein I
MKAESWRGAPGNREWGIGNRKGKRAPAFRSSHSPFPIPYSRHANGFTLLEVLAAILLLGIAFAVLMQVAGGAIGLTGQAADASEAAMWARSKLDSAYVVEPLQPGHSAGRFDRKFEWQLDVTPWHGAAADDQAPLQLYQLDLQVSWGAAAHPHTANFRTLRLLSTGPGSNPMAPMP